MAVLTKFPSSLITISLLFFITTEVVTVDGKNNQHRDLIRLVKKAEKVSHLHFYFHDTISGPNATVVQVASGSKSSKATSTNGFGDIFIIDDPLTEGPEPSSKLIGRAQGMYASTSQSNDFGLLMNINHCFLDGEYKGSTISVLGRNMVMSEVREMPVVGGTGLFRLARGFVRAKTHSISTRTAIVEYNAFVFHY